MISQEYEFGTTLALDVCSTSQSDVAERYIPQNLQELLEEIKKGFPGEPHGMLAVTAGHIAKYIGVPLSDLLLDAIELNGFGFSRYLTTRRFKKNSIRSYRNYYCRLLKLAKELGWTPKPPAAVTAWEDALQGSTLPPGCSTIAQYSIAMGILPHELTEDGLVKWTNSMVERGRSHLYVSRLIYHLRRFLFESELDSKFPQLLPYRKLEIWAIPVEQMPEPLRTEVMRILSWKQADFAPGRPRRGKHRKVSARILEECIARLYGYAVTFLEMKDITTLLQLVSEFVISAYLSWSINDKKLSVAAVGGFRLLLAAIRHYPTYKGVDFGWFKDLMDQLPKEDQSEINERKLKKYLPHIALSTIPGRLAELRRHEKKGTRAYVLLLRDELIIRWELILPWRQRNLREMRLGNRGTDNLFKEGFPENINIAKPQWVIDELAKNPEATFWQVYFRRHETKTGMEVRGVVPWQLVALLEEYIDCRHLLAGVGAGNILFVNHVGNPLISREVTDLIGNLSARYCGKRVTPHLFRDAFAHRWLDEHPDDYLTLSKVLWHRDVKTTIRIYGKNFDESHGMKKAAEWIESHETSNSR